MIRPVVRMGDPRLLRVARPVERFDDPQLAQLLADMEDTMAHLNGAGLAAPQIGVDLRVVIFGTGEVISRYPDAAPIPRTVLVNPVLEPVGDDEEEDWEGCLSVPGLRGEVPRWSRVRYRGYDPHGQPIERQATGFHARVVQHECDHLDGLLYPMRIRDFTRFGYVEELFGDRLPPED